MKSYVRSYDSETSQAPPIPADRIDAHANDVLKPKMNGRLKSEEGRKLGALEVDRPKVTGPLPCVIRNIPKPDPLDPEPQRTPPRFNRKPNFFAAPKGNAGSEPNELTDPFADLPVANRDARHAPEDVRQGNPLSEADSGLQRFLDDNTEGRSKALESLFRDAIEDLQPAEEKGENKKKRWFWK